MNEQVPLKEEVEQPAYTSPWSKSLNTEAGVKPAPVDDSNSDVPTVETNPYSRGLAGLPPKKEYTEVQFHADAQSIADSRTLASRIISAPEKDSATQGHQIAVNMAMGLPDQSLEDIKATLDAEKEADPAYQQAYRDSLTDGDFTAETLDWLGTTRWNMVKTGSLAFEVGDWSEEEQVALVRLMAQYEELPVSWATVKRASKGLATDPTTYFGLGFLLSSLSKVALKPAAHATVMGLLKTAKGAGTVGAIEVGGYMATDNLLQQKIKVETGQQDEYDLVETAMYGAAGAAGGFTLIGGLTALLARGAAKKASRNTDEIADEVVGETDEVADEAIEVADDVTDEAIEEVDEAVDEVLEQGDEAVDMLDEGNEEDWLAEMEAELGDEFTNDDFAMLGNDVDEAYSDEVAYVEANGQVDSEIVPVEELPPTTVMPKGLAGAKPRYGYGQLKFKVKFESDVDKALYIVAGSGSKAHDDYMRFLRGVFPNKTVDELTEMGKEIKGKLKASAKARDADIDGDLVVNATFEPTKKPRRPEGESKANDPKPSTKVYEESSPKDMPYNVNRMDTAQDVKNLVIERAEHHLAENPRTVRTLEEVTEEGHAAAKELAEKTGADFDSIVKLLDGDVAQLQKITARIKATRDLHVWTFEELKRLAYKHRDVNLNKLEMAELIKVTEMINQLTPLTLKQSAEQSRVLGSRRAMAISDDSLIRGKIDGKSIDDASTEAAILEAEAETILPAFDKNAMDAIANGNGPYVIDKLVKQIIDGIESGKIKSPKDVRKQLEVPKIAKIIAEVNRIRAGSMLGGLSTTTLAAVSNHFHMIWEPALEYASRMNLGLTKAGRKSQVEDKLARTRALAQYAGNYQFYKQGWKEAMKAVKMGIHITDPNVTHLESSAGQVGNKYKSKKRIAYEQITGYAHTILMALDEQHKFTRAHSLAFADAVVAAKRLELNAKEAGKTSFTVGSAEYKKFIKDEIAKKFDKHGAVTDEAIKAEIRMETFTEELVGPIGSAVNGIARLGWGAGALVLPFRRAPVNSISYAMQYVPIPEIAMKHLSQKQGAILRSGDKVQIAKLRARKKVGAMAMGYLWMKAEQGEMTGGGPSDYRMRKAWEQAGNKPYSVKIGDTWVPYEKIEPFSTIMGSVANAQYIWKMNPEKYHKGMAHIMEAVQMSITHSILNKAYFQSVSDWMKALTGEDNKTVSIAHGVVTSFVPNAIGQLNRDPNVREATDLMEKVQRKLWGWSQEMGAQYDVTGQPLLKPNDGWNLFKTPDARSDTSRMAKSVMQEIFDLRVVQDKEGLLGEPPRNLSAGRDDYRDVYDAGESESVYAKYNRFIGETRIGGKTLEEALYETINSASYQSKPKSPYLDVNSPHVARLAKVIKKFRQKAKRRLMDESPAFHNRYNDLQQRKLEVKRAH